MDALKLDCAANTDAVKEEKPAVHFHTDCAEETDRTVIGDAAKVEEPELGQLPHHYASSDGQSAITDNLISVTVVEPIVIAPLKMETGGPYETVFATTVGASDELQCENSEPTTPGVMTEPQQKKPRPLSSAKLGPDRVCSGHGEAQHVKCDPRIHSPSQEENKRNANATMCDERPQKTKLKPSAKQIDKISYQCTLCSKSFAKQVSLENHMETHSGEKIYPCTVCSKSFSRNGNLKVHMQTHTGEKPYQCTVCSKSFCQAGSLKMHMCIHTGEKPYMCSVCFKSFSQSIRLKIHMHTHTGEQPHHCTVCSKSFSRSDNLKLHMLSHGGEKPHQCVVCSKSFSQSTNLNAHMRTHTGEKPHQCPVCSDSFTRSDTLKVHMRIHTGEKPYMCTVCFKSFCRSGELKRHMHTHAGEQPRQCTM